MTTKAMKEYVRHVSDSGPDHPAYDGLRIFQHIERAVLQLAGLTAEIFPITAEVWPSLSCNARCPLCPYRMSGARNVADGTQELFLSAPSITVRALREFADLGGRSIIFTGGGEPLLHPGVANMARSARRCGLSWALFTNGSHLAEGLARKLLLEHPAFLRVSLDAGTADEHDRIYRLGTDAFESILSNVVGAATVAADLGSRAFGLSFTLGPRVSDNELCAIKDVVCQVEMSSGGGLGLVAFRPRLVHFKHGKPVAPQPWADGYTSLTRRINALVIEPIRAKYPRVLMDIKSGLFGLARRREPVPCFSSCWTTTIGEDGTMWAVPELAGSEHSWGRYTLPGDLGRLWNSSERRSILDRFESGALPVPIVHRTSPIDELVRGVREVTTVETRAQARELVVAVANEDWYRSSNADFA